MLGTNKSPKWEFKLERERVVQRRIRGKGKDEKIIMMIKEGAKNMSGHYHHHCLPLKSE